MTPLITGHAPRTCPLLLCASRGTPNTGCIHRGRRLTQGLWPVQGVLGCGATSHPCQHQHDPSEANQRVRGGALPLRNTPARVPAHARPVCFSGITSCNLCSGPKDWTPTSWVLLTSLWKYSCLCVLRASGKSTVNEGEEISQKSALLIWTKC